MSFVIPRAQKAEKIQKTPGPGYYSKLQDKKKQQHCAPFNHSQLKSSIFDVQISNSGPGSYQPKYHKDLTKMIKPDQKSYMFASKVNRFQSENNKNLINDDKAIDDEKKRGKQNITVLRSKSLSEKQFNENEINSQNSSVNEIYIKKSEIYDQIMEAKEKRAKSSLAKDYYNSNQAQKYQNYQKKLQKSKEAMQELRLMNNKKKVNSIKSNKDFVRVILASTSNTENLQSKFYHRSILGKTIGPGSYSDYNTKSKPKNVSSWQKQRVMRFKTEGEEVPGPGTYEQSSLNTNNKHKNTSSFANSQMRSHIDSLIYRTNIPLKAAIIENKKIKDSQPGPGSYQNNMPGKNKKSFNYGVNTNFGTSNRDFMNEAVKISLMKPGPGAYQNNIVKKNGQCNQIIKQIRNQIFGKAKKQNKIHKNLKNPKNNQSYQQINKVFSKGQYERKNQLRNKVYSLQERCFSKFGNMSQQPRFKNNETKYEDGLSFQYIPQTPQKKGIQKNQSAIFKSETGRQAFSIKNQDSNFQFYNITRNDIGYKAEKLRRYIQDLRKINIQKTPFQSGAKRFAEKNIIQVYDNDREIPMIFQQDTHENRRQIQVQKPVKETSVFKSTSKRNVFPVEQQIVRHKFSMNQQSYTLQKHLDTRTSRKPGPGDYQARANYQGKSFSLQKKSFNKYYHYKGSNNRVIANKNKKYSMKQEQSEHQEKQ